MVCSRSTLPIGAAVALLTLLLASGVSARELKTQRSTRSGAGARELKTQGSTRSGVGAGELKTQGSTRAGVDVHNEAPVNCKYDVITDMSTGALATSQVSNGSTAANAVGNPAPVTEDFSQWGVCQDCRVGRTDRLGGLVLVWIGLCVTAVFVERWITFAGAVRTSKGFEPEVIPAVRARELEAALDICRRMNKSPLAELAEPVILEMKSAGKVSTPAIEAVRLASLRAGLVVRERFRKEIRNLVSASILAPMIGFLMAALDAHNAFGVWASAEGRALWPVAVALEPALASLGFGVFLGIVAHIGYRVVLAKSSALENRLNLLEADLLAAWITSTGGGSSRRQKGLSAYPGLFGVARQRPQTVAPGMRQVKGRVVNAKNAARLDDEDADPIRECGE